MGIFRKDDNRGIERLFIELSDEHKGDLVYKWPDQQIRRKSKITVDMDYVAVFTSSGKIIDVLQPGQHTMEEGASPLTAWLIDHLTADRYYDTELFYVSTREQINQRFGGTVDTVSSLDTGLVVTLRVFGQYSFKITDPTIFLSRVHGSTAASSSTVLREWCNSQVLAAIREELPSLIGRSGVLSIGQLQDETERKALDKANLTLSGYGVQLTNFGELNVNLSEQDSIDIKEYVKRQRYAEMAGGYDKFAVSEAFINASADGTSPQEMLMLNMMMNSGMATMGRSVPQDTTQSKPIITETRESCRSCSETVPENASFCASCGAKQNCTSCNGRMGAGKFCPSCGHNNEA